MLQAGGSMRATDRPNARFHSIDASYVHNQLTRQPASDARADRSDDLLYDCGQSLNPAVDLGQVSSRAAGRFRCMEIDGCEL
jgi:hypothetical protein